MVKQRRRTVLFAGEEAPPGSGRYLLAILHALKVKAVHAPATARLSVRQLTRRYAAFILSDFPSRQASPACQQAIVQHVKEGAGLLMIGGWGSFSGPSGGWRGSRLERLLPVRCLNRDDRINFPSGALVIPTGSHPMWDGLSFRDPPVICGLNDIRPRPTSRVLLYAQPIVSHDRAGRLSRVALDARQHPLLVIGTDPRRRVAALATDAAPHWCGGLIDWGTRRVRIAVTETVRSEVGDRYLNFFSCLIRWLMGAPTS